MPSRPSQSGRTTSLGEGGSSTLASYAPGSDDQGASSWRDRKTTGPSTENALASEAWAEIAACEEDDIGISSVWSIERTLAWVASISCVAMTRVPLILTLSVLAICA